jgi:aminoglycoside phosphotransferase (APT) family kinase protein
VVKEYTGGMKMKSITKNLLTEDQIRNLVKVNFGDSCGVGNITELKGGMFNSAYLIERPQEKDGIVLKVSIKPGTKTLTYEKDPMPTEVAVFKLVEERTTIPTPRVLAHDFSKKHIPSNYFFMTALEGIAMNRVQKKMSKENEAALKKELAVYLAQLHHIKGDYFGYFTEDENRQYKTWKEAFLHMMSMLLEDGKKNGTKLPYERYERVLKDKSGYLEAVKEPSLVDYDLWSGNVFVKQQGENYALEGIIDFERAFWGDPLADFGGSVMLLDNIYEEADLWKVYQEKVKLGRELSKDDYIRRAFYGLYIYTIMAVETFRYGFVYSRIQGLFAMKNIKKYLKILEEA